MGLFKDAGESLKKYGHKVVDKTGDLARQAKLSMEISRLKDEMTEAYADVGRFVLKARDSGRESIELKDSFIIEISDNIASLNKKIENLEHEISGIKKKAESGKEKS